MVKLLKRSLPVLIVCTLFFSTAWAIDYSQLSIEELIEFKGAVQNAPESEQVAYNNELQKRLDAMTDEEKEKFSAELKSGDQQNSVKGEAERAPFIQSRGYDKQGTGNVIFGGGDASKIPE